MLKSAKLINLLALFLLLAVLVPQATVFADIPEEDSPVVWIEDVTSSDCQIEGGWVTSGMFAPDNILACPAWTIAEMKTGKYKDAKLKGVKDDELAIAIGDAEKNVEKFKDLFQKKHDKIKADKAARGETSASPVMVSASTCLTGTRMVHVDNPGTGFNSLRVKYQAQYTVSSTCATSGIYEQESQWEDSNPNSPPCWVKTVYHGYNNTRGLAIPYNSWTAWKTLTNGTVGDSVQLYNNYPGCTGTFLTGNFSATYTELGY